MTLKSISMYLSLLYIYIYLFLGNWNDDNCNEQMGFICKKRIGQSGPITPTPPIIVQGGCANNFVPEPYGN